jgi:L-threonylcarbamoyladenylate synthase
MVPKKPLPPTLENLRLAGEILARGGLVVLPTETVYGLGANALDARAVARIFEAKGRPSFDPLIVHVASIGEAELVAEIPGAKARALMERLWPGPLTLVMPKRDILPDIVTSGLPTVAVRFPSHPIARAIIAYCGKPVAAPSANPFGYLSPTRAEHVAATLGDRVDLIIDGGSCPVGVESTVVDLTLDPPVLLRPGGMAVEAIEAVIGRLRPREEAASYLPEAARAGPGMLDSHYAPRAELVLFPQRGLAEAALREAEAGGPGPAGARSRRAALLFDSSSLGRLGDGASLFDEIRLLSPSGDLVEAAASLFSFLHELDGLGMDSIWAERVPESGLGRAINDRLFKASRK